MVGSVDLQVTCRYNRQTEIVTARIRDMHTGGFKRQRILALKVYPYYNTDETVEPQGRLYRMNKEDLK